MARARNDAGGWKGFRGGGVGVRGSAIARVAVVVVAAGMVVAAMVGSGVACFAEGRGVVVVVVVVVLLLVLVMARGCGCGCGYGCGCGRVCADEIVASKASDGAVVATGTVPVPAAGAAAVGTPCARGSKELRVESGARRRG